MHSTVRRAARYALLGAVVAAIAVWLPHIAAAQSTFEQIRRYDSDITIESSGALLVRETIDYEFGSTPHHGIFRDIPYRFDYSRKDSTDRVTPIDVLSVQSSDAPDQYETSDFENGSVGYLRIKIGDPDRTITGHHTYVIKYRVQGALNGFRDHDELSWNAVGGNWPVIIDDVTATVHAPSGILQILCVQGATGSSLPCTTATTNENSATFAQDRLFPFWGMTITIAIPKGAVPTPRPVLEERFSLARAFSLDGPTVGGTVALAAVLLGGYAWLFRRFGRDRRFRGFAIDQAFGSPDGEYEITPYFDHTDVPVEFVPPDHLRAGQVGTLIDFAANPLDVTATMIDLAVRKYLVIDEVSSTSRWAKADWKLTKLRKADGDLLPYERKVMDGLFQKREEVQLSDLRYKFATRMRGIEKALMDDAMQRKWFTHRPEQTRLLTVSVGVGVLLAGVALMVVLAAFTSAALLAVPIVLLGLVILFTARLAPARTATGSAALRRVNGFRRFINESEKERARFAEQKQLFSEYLPYAIVFGATERWARAFEGLEAEPPDMSWYRSTMPFNYVLLASALDNFTVSTAGTLTSTPPSASSGSSGFSGGGFSGGGFGGGGGGSW